NRVEAERNRTQAANERLQGVRFRALSEGKLASDPGLALALAIEAERHEPGFESNMAQLRALIHCRSERVIATPPAANSLDVSCDGRIAVSLVGGGVALLDPVSGGVTWRAEVGEYDRARLPFTRVSPRGDLVLVGGGDGPVQVLDAATGARRYTLASSERSAS